MNKLTIYLGLLCIFCFPLNSPAATKNVTITWTMPDTSNVTGYRMYYAYDNMMSNKTLACETSDKSVTSLTCPDVDLQSSPVYFEIAAITTEGEASSSPREQTFSSGISPVQDFRLITTEDTQPPSSSPEYKINFQPASAPVPAGFSPDSGESFSETRGYGWFAGTNSTHTRDTDNPTAPNQAYDTLISVNEYGRWEFIVPNGNYSVKIVVGDADWPDGTSSIQAEGKAIMSNETLTNSTKWIEREGSVQVTDGRLTLTFAGSTTSKLCFLVVTRNS